MSCLLTRFPGIMDQQNDHWRLEYKEHLLYRWHSVHENIKTIEAISHTESQSWLIEVIILTKNAIQPKLELEQDVQGRSIHLNLNSCLTSDVEQHLFRKEKRHTFVFASR